MSVPRKIPFVSFEEYLRNEEKTSIRHEYYDGHIHAMTGASGNHREICSNIYVALHKHLKESTCRASMKAAAVRIEESNCVYYPDVVVSCGKFLPESILIEQPVLIVEVLSTYTASTDRREKLSNYKKLPSLKEYLIVHQKYKRLEFHRRVDGDTWETLDYNQGDIELNSLAKGPLVLSFALIYDNVEGAKDWKVHEEEPPPYTFEYYEQEGVLGW